MGMITLGKHEPTTTASGIRCKVCGQVFKHIRLSMTFCPGKGYYVNREQVPKHLKTTTQLARAGKRPKQGAVATAWVLIAERGQGTCWVDLWDAQQVERKQPAKKKGERTAS